SSSGKPSGFTPNITNPVEIAKFSDNFVNGGGSPRKRLNDISNFTPSADKQTSVILTEGSKEYRIAAPDHKSVNLHQPKICKAQLDTLKGLVQLGISFASNYSITMGSYKTYERHLCENRFLRSHEFLEHILHHLENGNTESFIQQHLEISKSDYNQRSGKYVDDIDFLKILNSTEIAIVEAS
ncbi:hypothetical protein CU098_006446, partial [Rhizopus stolonifer]